MTTPNESYSPRLDIIAFAIIAISFGVRYWFVATGQLNLVRDIRKRGKNKVHVHDDDDDEKQRYIVHHYQYYNRSKVH